MSHFEVYFELFKISAGRLWLLKWKNSALFRLKAVFRTLPDIFPTHFCLRLKVTRFGTEKFGNFWGSIFFPKANGVIFTVFPGFSLFFPLVRVRHQKAIRAIFCFFPRVFTDGRLKHHAQTLIFTTDWLLFRVPFSTT